MTLLSAAAIAVLFSVALAQLMKRDLVKLVAGALLLTNASILFVVATSLPRTEVPIAPLPPPAAASDPLAQAVALTAVVISFGVSAFLMVLMHQVQDEHGTLDVKEIAKAEARAEARSEDEAP